MDGGHMAAARDALVRFPARRGSAMPFADDDVLAVEEVDEERWRTLQPLAYRGREQTVRIAPGFITDFASVPHFLLWFVPSYGSYTKAAVVHDYLCRHGAELVPPVPRSSADGIFRRQMREAGVRPIRRWLMWAAVRLQGAVTAGDWRQVGAALAMAVVGLPAIVMGLATVPVVAVYRVVDWVARWVEPGWPWRS